MRAERPLALVAVAIAMAAAACTGPQAEASDDERHCVALAVHVGMLGKEPLSQQLQRALSPLAQTGGTLTVWRATRSAASLEPLIRQQDVAAVEGDEDRVAAGAASSTTALVDRILPMAMAAAESARDNEAAAASSVDEAEPVDLLGSLREMGTKADGMKGCGHKAAVLVTGGGIHRTKDLDLVNLPGRLTTTAATQLAIRAVETPPGVTQAVYGVGNFEQVTPEVDADFADALEIVWKKACACLAGE